MTVLATHPERRVPVKGSVPAQHRDHALLASYLFAYRDHDQRQRSFARLDCRGA
jgi:hypothetical protein